MCEMCNTSPHPQAAPRQQRIRLWEFADNAHCPVIGTCLAHDDLLRIARKLRLHVEPDARDYDVHGYFVKASVTDSREARAMHKLLDERHAGALRKFSRVPTREGLLELWDTMKESGQIAGAFYALMTLRHVPIEVRSHVFGEVHMLSHLMGASYRKRTAETRMLREQLAELAQRRERVEARLQSALAERDREIAELRDRLAVTQARAERPKRAPTPARADRGKGRRAIDTARARARLAQAENEILRSERDMLRRRVARLEIGLRRTAAAPAAAKPVRLEGQSFLYVGGRDSQVSRLRDLARTFGAKLIHHDGGLEDSVGRIDEVLPSVDCVLCPVDCVSHDACLRAKNGCKKLGKAFVPLRSASQASLRQALEEFGRVAQR